MEREDEVSTIRDEELLGIDDNALRLKSFDFLAKANGVEDHAVANRILLAWPENAGGNQVEDILLVFDDDGVSCVRSSLATDHEVSVGGE